MTALDPVLPREVVCGDRTYTAGGAVIDRAGLEDAILAKLDSRGASAHEGTGLPRALAAGLALRIEDGR